MKVSICCGAERSEIYPRDCWKCGALFVPIEIPDPISPAEKGEKLENPLWIVLMAIGIIVIALLTTYK